MWIVFEANGTRIEADATWQAMVKSVSERGGFAQDAQSGKIVLDLRGVDPNKTAPQGKVWAVFDASDRQTGIFSVLANAVGQAFTLHGYARYLIDPAQPVRIDFRESQQEPAILPQHRIGVNSELWDMRNFLVSNEWAGSIGQSGLGADWVRVVLKTDANHQPNIAGYKQGIAIYHAHGVRVLAVVNAETVPRLDGESDFPWADPLKEANHANHYIERFVDELKVTVPQLPEVDAWEIWNEPNVSGPTFMPPDNFGSLMYYAYLTIRAFHPAPIISGGLFYHSDLPEKYHKQYLEQLYNSFAVQFAVKTGLNRYPWDGLGIHPYHMANGNMALAIQHMQTAIRGTLSFMRSQRIPDPASLWATEFGDARPSTPQCADVTQEAGIQAQALRDRFTCLLGFPEVATAIYFLYQRYPYPSPPAQPSSAWGLVDWSGVTPGGQSRAYHSLQQIIQMLPRSRSLLAERRPVTAQVHACSLPPAPVKPPSRGRGTRKPPYRGIRQGQPRRRKAEHVQRNH